LLFGETIVADAVAERVPHGTEGGFDALNRRPSTLRRAEVAEPAFQDLRRGQSKLARQRHDRFLVGLDEIRAGLRVLAARKPFSNRPDSTAHPVSRFNDIDLGAVGLEGSGGRQACQAGSRDEYPHSAQRHLLQPILLTQRESKEGGSGGT